MTRRWDVREGEARSPASGHVSWGVTRPTGITYVLWLLLYPWSGSWRQKWHGGIRERGPITQVLESACIPRYLLLLAAETKFWLFNSSIKRAVAVYW